ncbi:MAG TPA: hypothetical protein VGN70_06415 [Gammaproteobacteria bacterium]|jgi:hypothetical protein
MYKISLLPIVLLGGALASVGGCASAPPPGYACPGTVDGFLPDDATSAEVEHCLGKPDRKDDGPDGRYTYDYKLDHGVTAAFLFSSGGRLISVASPAANPP